MLMRETPEWINFRRYNERQVKIEAGQMYWLERGGSEFIQVFIIFFIILINEINVVCDYMRQDTIWFIRSWSYLLKVQTPESLF